jgi:Cu2+-exporting ATPase
MDHENMTRDHVAHAHRGHNQMGHGHTGHHHGAMIADFRRRFWVSLILTVPVLALSPLIQNLFGLQLRFPGDSYVLFGLSAIVFFYGGWPFLTGLIDEVSSRRPGMMTLIGAAITVAFVYSTAVVFGLPGEVFFWELVTLVDIMLLGHWIEMKSVLGASRALEALVQLLPATAHRLKANDEAEDVPVADLKPGDRVLVKPGERVPIDGIIVKGRSSFNEAMLTGESRPVEKIDYIGLSAGGLTLLVWLGIGQSFVFALERMVTVMGGQRFGRQRTALRSQERE